MYFCGSLQFSGFVRFDLTYLARRFGNVDSRTASFPPPTRACVVGTAVGTDPVERIWVWVKVKPPGRRFWSMFPLTRASHFGYLFLTHSHMLRMDSHLPVTCFSLSLSLNQRKSRG